MMNDEELKRLWFYLLKKKLAIENIALNCDKKRVRVRIGESSEKLSPIR